MRVERDEASRAVLRAAPTPSLSPSGLAMALYFGFLTSAALTWAALDLPPGRTFPRVTLLLLAAVSAAFLLRSAWRFGRILGARGP